MQFWAGFLTLALVAGCGSRAKITSHTDSAEAGVSLSVAASPTAGTPPSHSTEPVESAEIKPATRTRPAERWELIQIENQDSGYVHTLWTEEEHKGEKVHVCVQETKMRLLRFGETVSQTVKVTSRETPDGSVVNCGWAIDGGGQSTKCTISFGSNQYQIKTTTGGLETESILNGDGVGYFNVEHSLASQPMKPKEIRKLTALMPVFNAFGKFSLKAVGIEATEMQEGPRELMRIDCQLQMTDSEMKFEMWTDNAGRIVKQRTPGINQIIVACTKDRALTQHPTEVGNVGTSTLIPIKNVPPNIHTAKSVTYRMCWNDSQPIDFPISASQKITLAGSDCAEIKIHSVRPELGDILTDAESKGIERYLLPTRSIQSNDLNVVALAESVKPTPGSGPVAWRTAVALERLIHDTITVKDFSQLFASAAEVAESHRGDCTEHAVLLAAVCRARKIPARVVSGLVHLFGHEAFGFHMWNEVWIHDKWIPLDATLGLGGIGSGHIKLAEEQPDENTGMGSMLSIMNAIGKMELEVVSFTP
jgi:hypothetical protein